MREEANNSLPPVERYKAIGNDLFKSTKFDEAIKAYTKAIDAAGDNPVFDDVLIACYNNRAACYQQFLRVQRCRFL